MEAMQMKGIFIAEPKELQQLANVAMGDEKADLVILNWDLVNVYTRELHCGYAVAIKGKRIAYVGADAAHPQEQRQRSSMPKEKC